MAKKFHTPLDAAIVAYATWVLRHYRLTLAVSLAVVALCCVGLQSFVLNNDYEAFFDENDARMTAYEEVQREYSTDDTVFFVVTAEGGEIFDNDVLAAVAHLSDKAWELPYATRVDSLTTFLHAWSEGDDLLVAPLIETPGAMTAAELARAKAIAENEPMLRNRLLKEGSHVTGVNVTINVPTDVPRVSTTITQAAEALMAETLSLYPAVSLRLTGLVPMNNAFLLAAITDMTTLAPLMLLVILIVMAVLLKSFWLMAAVMIVVSLSSMSSVGILSWMGYEVTGPITVMPLIVLTLAVANCVHILVSMQTAMRQGLDKAAAIVESLRINMLPVFVTSLTTAIGFLCMNFTPVPPLRVLGNFTAIGMLLAFCLSVVLLPALVYPLPFRVRAASSDGKVCNGMGRLAEFVLNNKHALCVALTALTLLIAMNIPAIRINNQFIEWLDKETPIRRDTEYAMEHLTGIYQLIFNVPAGEEGGVNEPAYLANLDKFVGWMGAQEGVVQVSSIADTMKRLNKAMHDDDPAMYRIPESRELAAQYLLLYEMSLPMGMDLNTEVNMNKSATRVVVTTSNLRSEDMSVLIAKAETWQRQHLPERMFAPALGPAVMFSEVSRTMMESMMISAPLAMILVSIALMVALRSVKYGIISLAPNVMPLLIGFGIWGYQGWDMNFGMTTIVAMSVGIVVDDTVHFLAKYLRARRELNLSPEDGIRYAFTSVGKAMWVTSFILVAGFSIMTLSPMAYSGNMGTLTSMIIVAALVGDFLLLPSILLYTDTARESAYASLKDVRHEEKVVGVEA